MNLIFHSEAVDTRVLRGGYDMIMPHSFMFFGDVKTDQSKKLIFDVKYELQKAGNNSATSLLLEPGVTYRPFNKLKFGLTTTMLNNDDELQYVKTADYQSDKRYILGTIDQKTYAMTFRMDLNITPEFSIQYYGSPFFSKGKYSQFKYVVAPKADDYNDRFLLYTADQLIGADNGVDENRDSAVDYTIGNPDFNFHEFRSNLVAKWEYRLGSFIYFVWSSQRSETTGDSGASLGESYQLLKDVHPRNIFLIKLNYWFSL